MNRKRSLLTDIEDRVLAACDDMYLEATIANHILSLWYKRRIGIAELRAVYLKLRRLGLLKTYIRKNGRIVLVPLSGVKTEELIVKATPLGLKYLAEERHVV